ncbi:hypothetical protein F4827_003910 [Paraburkholderia bannensis]|uniref:Uncharacterized protein n=1 Tax=Paraburkholderia bannensis TaxID=765414 RepID=A0A7W9WU74_9BURK|nr:hypothetical protein [Paraburkholderia sp. WP4_3_2]MBB6104051.1 hypothetical protein [Paraburkholderia bannensis]
MQGSPWRGSKDFGGLCVLSYGWDMLVVTVCAPVFYYRGAGAGYRTEYLDGIERLIELDISRNSGN